jgi:hypothetical protein
MHAPRRLFLFVCLALSLVLSGQARGQAGAAPNAPPAPTAAPSAPPAPSAAPSAPPAPSAAPSAPPAPPPSAQPPAPPTPPAGAEEGAEDDAAEDEGEEVTPEGGAKEEADEAGADEEDVEDAELLGDENPGRPPPKGMAVIWGVVSETEFKETLVEATVSVVGTKTSAITDVEGRFRLELPPGTYSLRVGYELHKTARIDSLTLQAGQVLQVDVPLTPDKDAVDVFEVVEEADKTSLEGLILARQKATVIGDSVGRAEISKTPDRNAAQAAQRVVGATVVGGRFVYVRGLGERYTNALLDGAPLPSPEPDRAAVPLDLFPTGLLNSITIAKTFTPDSPADFAGGSVRIETREIPKDPFLQLSARLGVNTNSTFRDRLDYRGGSTDWFGIDDGTRALPPEVPDQFIGDDLPADQRTAAGRALNSYMSTQDKGTPPDHSIGVVGGSGWDLGNDRKLGLVGGFNWGRSYTVRRGEIVRVFTPPGLDESEYHVARDYRSTIGNMNVNWGAFGNLTYRFNARHQLTLTGLRTTLADDRTQVITGFHDVRAANIYATRLQFITRGLNMGMLRGEHRFPELGSGELDWNLVLSSAVREEPDRRDTVWQDSTLSAEQAYAFTDAAESGRHFYADQSETQYGGGLDWTQPIGARESKLKGGGLFSLRNRDFWSRALTIGNRTPHPPDAPLGANPGSHPVLTCPSGNINACNDSLFLPENIGSNAENALELQETRAKGDTYDAKLNIFAAYVMADLALPGDFGVVIGERIEYTRQTIDATNEYRVVDPSLSARIVQTDLLPAVAGTWSMTKKSKLRASATRTLARPQLRELAPFTYQDYFGGRVEGGNPDLQITNITNLDLRFENFPTLREVLAASIFYKDFRNPIEKVIKGGGDEGSITFQNAEGAKLFGIELEAKKNLEALHQALKDFSVSTNFTFAHSTIEIQPGQTIALTNLERPMVNQAPWVFNFSLSYARDKIGTSATILYNVAGPRIAIAGSQGLDDIYEHPRNMLDFSVQQKFLENALLKLEIKNILNTPVLLTQGCGTEGIFGGTWHFTCSKGQEDAVSYYTEGATFSLTGSYEF